MNTTDIIYHFIEKIIEGDSESINSIIDTYSDGVKPIATHILDMLMSINEYLTNSDWCKSVAEYKYKKMESLCDAGFTRKEALQILIADEKELKESVKRVNTNKK